MRAEIQENAQTLLLLNRYSSNCHPMGAHLVRAQETSCMQYTIWELTVLFGASIFVAPGCTAMASLQSSSKPCPAKHCSHLHSGLWPLLTQVARSWFHCGPHHQPCLAGSRPAATVTSKCSDEQGTELLAPGNLPMARASYGSPSSSVPP